MPAWTLAAADHAFASGHAFERIDSVDGALNLIGKVAQCSLRSDAEVLLAVWRQFEEGALVGPNTKLSLNARLANLGERTNVEVSGDCVIRGVLRVEARGKLQLGRFCYVGDGALVSAAEEVRIGDATLLAHGVQVFDNNTHPIFADQRELQFRRMTGQKDLTGPMQIDSGRVRIGRRCWVGMNSLVMKGVSIGDNSLVAAGSVVVSDVPAGVIVAGNPARIVRELTAEERGEAAGSMTWNQ